MIRKRLLTTKRSEHASPEPRRRRLSGVSAPSLPQDERDLSDDDLRAKLRDSFLAEQVRIRNMIRQVVGDNILVIVRVAREYEQQRTPASSIASLIVASACDRPPPESGRSSGRRRSVGDGNSLPITCPHQGLRSTLAAVGAERAGRLRLGSRQAFALRRRLRLCQATATRHTPPVSNKAMLPGSGTLPTRKPTSKFSPVGMLWSRSDEDRQ